MNVCSDVNKLSLFPTPKHLVQRHNMNWSQTSNLLQSLLSKHHPYGSVLAFYFQLDITRETNFSLLDSAK